MEVSLSTPTKQERIEILLNQSKKAIAIVKGDLSSPTCYDSVIERIAGLEKGFNEHPTDVSHFFGIYEKTVTCLSTYLPFPGITIINSDTHLQCENKVRGLVNRSLLDENCCHPFDFHYLGVLREIFSYVVPQILVKQQGQCPAKNQIFRFGGEALPVLQYFEQLLKN